MANGIVAQDGVSALLAANYGQLLNPKANQIPNIRTGIVGAKSLPYTAGTMPFGNALYAQTLLTPTEDVRGARYIEYETPVGLTKANSFHSTFKNVAPLDHSFNSLALGDGTVAQEDLLQGNSVSDRSTRDAIRALTKWQAVHTTLQAQGVNGQRVGNPENNAIACVIGVPFRMSMQMQQGDMFIQTAVSAYMQTDLRSTAAGELIITNGIANPATSPTSIASIADQNASAQNPEGGFNYVTGAVYRKNPGSPEILEYTGYKFPQTAADVAAGRVRCVFLRLRQLRQQMLTAQSLRPTLAANGVFQSNSLVSAGYSTANAPNTPSLANDNTPVLVEVRLPAIPVGTRFTMICRADSEGSRSKEFFQNEPYDEEAFVQYMRVGLCGATDFALAEYRALERVVASSGADFKLVEFGQGFRFSENLFNIGMGANGVADIDAFLDDVDFRSSALALAQMGMVSRAAVQKSYTYLFNTGVDMNPTNFAFGGTQISFVANDPARRPLPLGFGSDLANLDGDPNYESRKARYMTHGLISRIPTKNIYRISSNFSFSEMADVLRQILQNGNPSSYDFLLSRRLYNEIIFALSDSRNSIFRIQKQESESVWSVPEYDGMHINGAALRFIVMPEFDRQGLSGAGALINVGTAAQPKVFPIYMRLPAFVTGNEMESGAAGRKWGYHMEIGLVFRAPETNGFLIVRD